MPFGSLETAAATRFRAITDIKVTPPVRSFANDADLDFSLADMGLVLDAYINFLVEAKDNGALFADLSLEIFEGALQGNAQQLYTDRKLKRPKQKGALVDGKTAYLRSPLG